MASAGGPNGGNPVLEIGWAHTKSPPRAHTDGVGRTPISPARSIKNEEMFPQDPTWSQLLPFGLSGEDPAIGQMLGPAARRQVGSYGQDDLP